MTSKQTTFDSNWIKAAYADSNINNEGWTFNVISKYFDKFA